MKPNKYLLLLITLSAFMACSKETGTGEEPEKPKGPVALDPHIAGVSLTTRGGAADATDISTLGIYAVPVTTTSTNADAPAPASSYHLYTLKNGNASPYDAANTLWLELYKVTIFSFHPAGAATDTPVTPGGTGETPVPTIVVPSTAITVGQTNIAKKEDNNYDFADAENDYMYGVAYDTSEENQAPTASHFLPTQPVANNGYNPDDTPKVNECGPEVAIGLKHAFAQIRFILKKGSTYAGDAVVTKVTYTRSLQTLIGALKNPPANPVTESTNGSDPVTSDERFPVTMNLTDGILNNLAQAAETIYSYTFADDAKVEATTDDNTIQLTNYILPNSSADAKIVITVDGKDMTLDRYSDTKFEAGNIYTYTIQINPTGLTLSGFTVVDWGENQTQPDITI